MLGETRGFDFAACKRSALHRRVRRRMALLNLATFGEYRGYLELRADEFPALLDCVLINATGFFRDPPAWQALREKVIPELLSAKSAKAAIRVWSAGCATGEEAYTLEIVLAEALGPGQLANGRSAAAASACQVITVNRRGKTVGLQIAASPMRTQDGEVSGIILVIDQETP